MYYLDILRLIGELKRTSVKNCLSNPFYQKYNQPLPRLQLVFLGSTTMGEVNLGHCLPKNIHLRSCQPKYAVLVTCSFVVNYIYCLFLWPGLSCPHSSIISNHLFCENYFFKPVLSIHNVCYGSGLCANLQILIFERNHWWLLVSPLVSDTKLSPTVQHRIL